jgi:hypothetical protein
MKITNLFLLVTLGIVPIHLQAAQATAPSADTVATIQMLVAPNLTGVSRSATVAIGGGKVTVTQSNQPCSVTSTAPAPVPANGGSGVLAVNPNFDNCTWSASALTRWLTINSGASGMGHGAVRFTLPANPGSASRTAFIRVAGKDVSIVQSGQSPKTSFNTSPQRDGAQTILSLRRWSRGFLEEVR